MIFSLLTGWLVDHYSFRPVFILFGVIPLVAAWIVWTLPRSAQPAHLPPQTALG
jgi:ACS family hexuronate transporter-like MFS transporter